MKKILFRTLFNGWKEVTEDQRERLIKHLNNSITAMSGAEKQEYINSRFIIN